jgi:hypothetical protein
MPRYRVRTPEHHELVYDNEHALNEAWLNGFIDPEDELLEEGRDKWRKVSSTKLMQLRPSGNRVWGGTQAAWMIIVIVIGSIALYLFRTGRYGAGFVTAFTLGLLMFRITYRAFKKSRPHS